MDVETPAGVTGVGASAGAAVMITSKFTVEVVEDWRGRTDAIFRWIREALL
jgi:hypothetical protein